VFKNEQTVASLQEAAHNVLALRGEYNLTRAVEVREQLYPLLAEALPLVVDLSKVSFLDAVTLGVLVEAVRRARRDELELVFFLAETGDDRVRDLLRITGLDAVLPLVSELGAAEAAASQQPR
jgi:anti-anti-sigma factor